MSFTDPFGGSTIQAAQVAYRAVALSSSIVTVWPPFATGNDYLARIMDVTPSAGSLTITLPAASLESPGIDCLFTNLGAQTYTVLDADGGTVMTVAAGQRKYIYLEDNSTTAGNWGVVVFGVGSSNLDAAALAGLGLKAITSTLNAASTVSLLSADATIAESDRAATYVWDGGAGTLSLPLVSTVGDDFYFELRNQGTGVLTLPGSSGELIDDSASIALQINESCFVHAGPTAWYTVGRGRNTQFNFTQLAKTVTGGTTTLTLTEASNVVQTYSGALTSNEYVVVPGVVQVYYIRNQTTGTYNFRVQSPTPGAVVDMPSGQNSILFCDGTNVYNATTYVSTVTNFPALTVSPRSSNAILGVSDRGSVLQFTGTFTQTFDPASILASGWYVDVQNAGTGTITLDANGAETFNTFSGALQTVYVYPGEGFRIVCNGTSFDLIGRPQSVVIEKKTITSGTTSDYENGWTDAEFNKIAVEWQGIEISVTDSLRGRVKKSGSYASGASYDWAYQRIATGGSTPQNGTAETSWDMTGASDFPDGSGGCLTISKPTQSTASQRILVDSNNTPSGAAALRSVGGLYESTPGAIQGFRFMPNTGAFTAGTVVVTGYRGS